VRYQVRLEGQDDEWHDVGARRVAYFLQLAPGNYVFRVRGANNDGVWNEAGASLGLTVLPFYWQTLWFRLLIAVALVGVGAAAVWLWFRSKLRRALEHQKAANQIRELAGRLIDAQEQERTRLARELHDDITQRLARLAIDVGRCEQGTTDRRPEETAREVRSGLAQLSEDVHALSYRLHPSILEDLGLAEALKAEIDRFQRQNSIAAKVKLRDLPDPVPPEVALCLFRVAQEALRNVARHSRATTVEISLRPADEGLQLAIQDDGAGFDPAAERHQPSLGLSSMKERVVLLGGELEIESAPGQGATVLAWVPLKSPKSRS
jgi:signal transduction histidine kinase